jgi:SAM-dependent methyltransferase
MNYRIATAEKIITKLSVSNVLDIGCRSCEAKHVLSEGIEYFGNDIFQNVDGSVNFVGDVLKVNFGRTFDCVIALDVVEHVDDPYALMDKIINLSEKYIIISLPNTYDLLHKKDFLFKSTLGKKYSFETSNSLDRHRWVMNYDEICEFYSHYAKNYGMSLEMTDVMLGASGSNLVSRIASVILKPVFGKRNLTRTIVALFTK